MAQEGGAYGGIGLVGMLRAAATSIASRAQWLQRAGKTFGGKRDVDAALGYETVVTPEMSRLRYERGGIAAAIMESFPEACWGAGCTIFDEHDAAKESKFEKAVDLETERLDIWNMLLRLDIIAGFGRYGVLLMSRGQDLSKPASPGHVLHLQPLSEELCKIVEWDENVNSVRYGRPEFYEATLGSKESHRKAHRVHHTHVIHFAEGNLSDEVYGRPRLERSWNRLNDLDKLVGGGSEAAWKRAHQGLHANADPEMTAGMDEDELKAQMEKVGEQLENYDNSFTRFIKTVGVDLNTLDGGPFNFSINALCVISIVAATEKIPQRILLGSERGALASKQDDDTFNDRVSVRRNRSCTVVTRQLFQQLIDGGDLPKPKRGRFMVSWPEEQELRETDKIRLANEISLANRNQKAAEGKPVMTSDEIRIRYLGLPALKTQDWQDMAGQGTKTGTPQDGNPAISGEPFIAGPINEKP